MHVDTTAARRMLFGSAVVHGMNAVLWALDSWLTDVGGNVTLRALKVNFVAPILVGEEVNLSQSRERTGFVRLELVSSQTLRASISLEWERRRTPDGGRLETALPPQEKPQKLSATEVRNRRGVLELYLHGESTAKLFPMLTKCMPPTQTAVLLGTSRLVGNECPGEHSLYGGLDITASSTGQRKKLRYEVQKFDTRFNLAHMNFWAPGLKGKIKAFMRPPLVTQRAYVDMKELVKPNEFANVHALIIGGSRGLGEVTAKLLAAGSARVRISYNRGREDAERIKNEIIAGGGWANHIHYNIKTPNAQELKTFLRGVKLTDIYYYATPFIFAGKESTFSHATFKKFCDYYVTGFREAVEMLRPNGVRNVLYPSTAAMTELPENMMEYVAAKGAGEMICKMLELEHPELTIYRPRLPRMRTDETATLLSVQNQDPVPIMLSHLRMMHVPEADTTRV